ncbi:MAG: hypothetical protein IKG32_00975 [Clostridia bacterium]|nr:hypothetical protein [Clostridia bacterium]
MGVWGTGLYEDDYTCDIRADYKDRLRKGMTNEEAMQDILAQNTEVVGTDDEPVLWFALADIQWEYGRLLPEVKEKALAFLDNEQDDDRWKTPQLMEQRRQVLVKLKEKLLSPQPPEKKVRKYNYFRCPWKLGDVFAYQFHTEESEKYGVKGQYIVFRKITEDLCWPGHIVPTVHLYQWIGKDLPTLEEIRQFPVLTTSTRAQNERERYLFSFLETSNRSVPHKYLTFLGNIQDGQLFDREEPDSGFLGYEGRSWRVFEGCFLCWYSWLVEESRKQERCQGDVSFDNSI